jgi:cytochrome c oxidase subunit 3
VRQGLSDDWRATGLPSVLWWNSLLLLTSSVTIEMARRKAGGRSQVAGRTSQVAGPRRQVAGRGSPVEGLRLQVVIAGERDELEDGACDLHLTVRKWLVATLLLGAGFLFGQFVAWRGLAARGIYLATNPSSSFFYLLTATHALHLLGGIIGLACVTAITWKKLAPGGRTGVGVTAIYWHFMDGLWIYILLLLLIVP